MENKYKKGDWVRYKFEVCELAAGTIAKVDDVFSPESLLVRTPTDGRGYYASPRELEPWQPKVGERVRVNYGHGWDGEGVVDRISGSIIVVNMKTGESVGASGGFRVSEIEPITDTLPVAEQPAALTIQAGRYYKTRDGRKVGPMRASKRADWPFIGNAEGELDAWYKADGACPYIPHDDLIAEWVDTPVRAVTAATVDAINDEYGPGGAAVDAPKFKVGDRVVATRTYADITAGTEYEVVEVDEYDEGMPVRVVDNVGDRYWLYDDAFRIVAPATPAIVCKIDNGQPLPATRPAVHATVESADAEAARLASIHKGQEFGVFVLTGATHKEAKVYEHEWQRLAAAGEKINAIKSLRNMAALDLVTAKRAVEVFIDKAA